MQEKQDIGQKQKNLDPHLRGDGHESPAEEIIQNGKFSESRKARKKYRDVATAAQEAFESAAYAAAAARAAVELSRAESPDSDPDDTCGPAHKTRNHN